MSDLVTVERDGILTVLTINRPPLNLMDDDLLTALEAGIETAAAGDLRGLLIRAEGKVFTGGVDVNVFARLDPESAEALAVRLLALVDRLAALPCPTILAAHALCLTWGLELALACDLLVAAEGVKFALVERIVGLTPFMGGPQRLALRVGPARAKEFVMTGAHYTAEELHQWGVVNKIFPRDGFDAAAREFARGIADGPTRAHAITKRLIDVACSAGEPAATALTAAYAKELFETEDTRNAVASFLRDGPGKSTFIGR
jgi:enoyl-CoA hydratase/carnithine racemase